MKIKHSLKYGALIIAGSLTLGACSNSDKSSPATFQIQVSNLTENQPFSPVAVIAHGESYHPWSIGSAASNGLEKLAESGSNSDLLTEADAVAGVTTTTGTGVILPGSSESVMLAVQDQRNLGLSVATMLVNTNDGFAGSSFTDVSQLAVGASLTVLLPAYDAGTEANSELSGTIPGPADGGEGFNSARDDVNVVSRHPGIVGSDSGYTSSVLNSTHSFDNPVGQVIITRLD